MINKSNKWIALIMVGSWVTLIFLGRKKIKRYAPAAIIMSFIILMESKIAKRYNWWNIEEKLFSNLDQLLPFIIGPFFVGSLWTLAYSYGRLPLYFLINGVIDAAFSFPFYHWFKKKGIWKLKNLSEFNLWLLMLAKSVILYLLQKAFEKLSPQKIEAPKI